eukprot:5796882-Pyramimonas_sp.AAC.1
MADARPLHDQHAAQRGVHHLQKAGTGEQRLALHLVVVDCRAAGLAREQRKRGNERRAGSIAAER